MAGLEPQPPLDAIGPNEATSDKGNSPPTGPPITPNVPPAPPPKSETHTCRPDQTPWWKIGLEFGAFALGIVFALTYHAQLEEMKRQSKATEDAVNVASDTLTYTKQQSAAQAITDTDTRKRTQEASDRSAKLAMKSLEATINNAHLDQRAWIGLYSIVGELKAGVPLEIAVATSNTGRTPAQKARLYAQRESIAPGSKVNFGKLTPVNAVGIVVPNGMFSSVIHQKGTALPSESDLAPYRAGKKVIVVYGKVTYSDVFGRGHWMTFCQEMSSDLHTYNVCAYGNDIDRSN